MTKEDRAKMEARLTIALPIWIRGRVLRNIQDFVAREVACAALAKRKAQRELRNVCHDCKVVMVDEGPPLCEGCVSKRGHEGMGREDWRTLEAWLKT